MSARWCGATSTELERRLADAGFAGSLFIILSHGGMAPVEEASRLAAGDRAVGTCGRHRRRAALRRTARHRDLMPFDMGGTSHRHLADRRRRRRAARPKRGLAGQRIALRSLDIVSIGAGGGSIASVDAGGTLRVGPQSAGVDAGTGLLRQGRRGRDRHRRQLVLGYLDADDVPWAGSARSITPRPQPRSTGSAPRWGCRARSGRGRHLPPHQPEDGGRHPADDVAPRRRSAALCAAELRRRGRAARGRGRARTRDPAHHRADARPRCCRRGACWPASCATR